MLKSSLPQHSTAPFIDASNVLHHEHSSTLLNRRMKTIGQIRRERLAILRRETGLSLADIGEQLGRSRRDATLSQIANSAPNTRTGKPRQMGDEQARALEIAFNKETGWFDNDPDLDALRFGHAFAAEPAATYTAWPFKRVSLADLRRLDSAQAAHIETLLLAAMAMVGAQSQPAPAGARAA